MTGFPIKLGMTENVLDTGRYGLPVLGFGILRRSTAYIHIGVSRHFLHPVGRIRQHDGPKESGLFVF